MPWWEKSAHCPPEALDQGGCLQLACFGRGFRAFKAFRVEGVRGLCLVIGGFQDWLHQTLVRRRASVDEKMTAASICSSFRAVRGFLLPSFLPPPPFFFSMQPLSHAHDDEKLSDVRNLFEASEFKGLMMLITVMITMIML